MLQEYILTNYEAIKNYLNECLDGGDLLCFLSQEYPALTCILKNLGTKTYVEVDYIKGFKLYVYSKNNDYVGLLSFSELNVVHYVDDAPVETIDDLEEVE